MRHCRRSRRPPRCSATGARRNNGQNDSWEITVTPSGNDAVTITLPGNRECATTGAICSKEEHPVQLSNSPSATVAGPAADPAVTNTAATGAPTISGTPAVGARRPHQEFDPYHAAVDQIAGEDTETDNGKMEAEAVD